MIILSNLLKPLKGKSFIITHLLRKGRLFLVFEYMDKNLLEVLEDAGGTGLPVSYCHYINFIRYCPNSMIVILISFNIAGVSEKIHMVDIKSNQLLSQLRHNAQRHKTRKSTHQK